MILHALPRTDPDSIKLFTGEPANPGHQGLPRRVIGNKAVLQGDGNRINGGDAQMRPNVSSLIVGIVIESGSKGLDDGGSHDCSRQFGGSRGARRKFLLLHVTRTLERLCAAATLHSIGALPATWQRSAARTVCSMTEAET
jgi:hypothetical protein